MTPATRDRAFDQFVQRYHNWKGMQPKGEQQTEPLAKFRAGYTTRGSPGKLRLSCSLTPARSEGCHARRIGPSKPCRDSSRSAMAYRSPRWRSLPLSDFRRGGLGGKSVRVSTQRLSNPIDQFTVYIYGAVARCAGRLCRLRVYDVFQRYGDRPLSLSWHSAGRRVVWLCRTTSQRQVSFPRRSKALSCANSTRSAA